MGRDPLILKIADAGEWKGTGLHDNLQALIFQLQSERVPMDLDGIRDLVGSVASTQARKINDWYEDAEEDLRFLFELREPTNWIQKARGKYIGEAYQEWRTMVSKTIRIQTFVTSIEKCPTALMFMKEADDVPMDLLGTWADWKSRKDRGFR